jgi:hypothetical protein
MSYAPNQSIEAPQSGALPLKVWPRFCSYRLAPFLFLQGGRVSHAPVA